MNTAIFVGSLLDLTLFDEPLPIRLFLALVVLVSAVVPLSYSLVHDGGPNDRESHRLYAVLSRLARSRQALVAAFEAERRRLRRDLHDGLGPLLATFTMRIDAARMLLVTDPSTADAILGQLYEDAQDVVADVRRLVYELRPPALSGLGLVRALQVQANRFMQASGGRLQIWVEGPQQLSTLPPQVELAAYRIASEALTNVVKHADATRCLLRLRVDRALHLEITDNGVGVGPRRGGGGLGLMSMQERARELGGKCTIERVLPHGTRVSAVLPLK